ncbi:MAG: glutaminyl-peptide cyclotransferase [Anaerolineaceae bacterium]|jgi:glutamine cyclotransferase
MKLKLFLFSLALIFLLTACNVEPPAVPADLGHHVGYEILAQFPHDRNAYTQGLVFHEGTFFESTGLYGESDLRQVDPLTGQILASVDLDPQYFGEGLALLNGNLYQLTWREGTGFVYDSSTLEKTGEFHYETEGWGLTTDGKSLIMSDGSSLIRFLDPQTFAVQRTIQVHEEQPIERINELEWIEGSLFANVYLSDIILRIDPSDGKVLSVINLAGLLPEENAQKQGEVLNGIAYDAKGKAFYVTGKHWGVLYQIRLVNEPAGTEKR